MPIRAYLVLYRTRIVWSAIIAIAFPIFLVAFIASDKFLDFTVLWNHFCGCDPDPGDAFGLLYAPMFSSFVIAVTLGLAAAVVPNPNLPANAFNRSSVTFLLTRPRSRAALVFMPVFIALLCIVLLPAMGLALTFGWMYLVHAPALVFFPKALHLVPEAATLSPSAPLRSLLSAVQAPRHYLAAVAMGFFTYALFYSPRWLALSRRPWIRFLAIFQASLLFITPTLLRFSSPRFTDWVYMLPAHHVLSFSPSNTNIALHLLAAFFLLFAGLRITAAADF